MMTKTETLNPVVMPLQGVSLIEASAGTGKTYTMASLYIRLLLQAGENHFYQPLPVDKILVVTFTEMATQELRERIRARIHHSKQLLLQYQATQDPQVFIEGKDPFLAELAKTLPDLSQAIQRLNWAEQSMDTAAIYTIHSFCHRVLMQYAFNSGVHFNLALVTDESELLERLTNEFWRETFYPQPLMVAKFIQQNFTCPKGLLKQIRSYLSGEKLNVELTDKTLLNLPLEVFFQQHLIPLYNAIEVFKQEWLATENILFNFLEENKTKQKNYRTNWVEGRFNKMRSWANNPHDFFLPEVLLEHFTSSKIAEKTKEGNPPLQHILFDKAEALMQQQERLALSLPIVLYHCIYGIRKKLIEYKAQHIEKGFDDLLRLVHEGLYAENGQQLANLIRAQYPFAMIDEFQDTDAQQYQIFSKIYIENNSEQSGFVMIGDPKQSIYKFRGADIFTYFKAAKQATHCFTLKENWRSCDELIQCVNNLFNFNQSPPFLFDDIHFSDVQAGKTLPMFSLNGQIEPAMRCYINDRFNQSDFAQICAASIQQWLKSAKENQANFGDEPLLAKNIAVLVRNRYEANLVKSALQNLGIASVYLSDKGNVFDSTTAQDIMLILTACLNPLNERHILNAIATRLFGLTSAEIYQAKQDENKWEILVEQFFNYQKLWQRKGILVMLHQLLLNSEITPRLLNNPQGERMITDFLHLSELLQQASRLNESEAALLRWFEKQIQGADRLEETIRLESERELVKIVTIHKSKGLAYDLVWLPFISVPAKMSSSTITTYYSTQQAQVLWDLENQHQELVNKEILAEEMRLLYVALTRAKYQVAMCLPEIFESKWNSLLYALTEGKIGLNLSFKDKLYSSKVLLQSLQQKVGEKHIVLSQPPVETAPLSSENIEQDFTPAIFKGKIESQWCVTSFTDMVYKHKLNKLKGYAAQQSAVEISTVFDSGKDYDLHSENNIDVEPTVSPIPLYPEGYSPFDLPSGVRVGTILHRYLEKQTMQSAVEDEHLNKLCQSLLLNEQWISPLKNWFRTIYCTPLLQEDNLCLAHIKPQDCLKEMQFYLKLNRYFDATHFNQILKKYHHFPSQDLVLEPLKGMLRGFIDLVFRHNGKYYVLDYKSNLLGNRETYYQSQHLPAVMQNGFYDWQYLLYTLALHRYLTQRDPNYQYERDFGGIFYLFLRGMNGKDQTGIFFDKPDWQLIQALEELF